MKADQLIVVGASAGGVAALLRLFGGLPSDWPTAIAAVLHLPARSHSNLPEIIARKAKLPASFANDGDAVRAASIVFAPPDRHLLVKDGTFRLSSSPKESYHRPSIDALFRTAARSYGERVIGVVLSGHLDDGTEGLAEIRRAGGVAIVQEPSDAEFPSMPTSALEVAGADHTVPVAEMGALLEKIVRGEQREPGRGRNPMAKRPSSSSPQDTSSAVPSVFGCPDCGGVLWEARGADLSGYECRVGHAFAPGELLDRHDETFEGALWAAVRALEEQSDLAARLAARAREAGHDLSAERYDERASEARARATLVRSTLVRSLERDDELDASAPEGAS
jgi:two-component system chemotaxis response regulator CheB